MKKRWMLLLLSVILVLNFVSCGTTQVRDVDHDVNSLFSYTYTALEEQEAREAVNRLAKLLQTEGKETEVIAAYEALMKAFERIDTQSLSAFLDYYRNMYAEDTAYSDRYMEISSLYDEIYTDIYGLFAASYGTEYEDFFFEGYTEEEKEAFLAEAAGYDQEYVSLSEEYNRLLDTYYSMDIVVGETDSSMAALYAETVQVNNRIAEKFGYDNYFDYAYEVIYGREYTPEDAMTLAEASIRDLYPILQKIVRAMELTFVSSKESRELEAFHYDSALAGEAKTDVDAYFESLGEKMNATYKLLHQNDLYVATSDINLSYAGAFTEYSSYYSLPVCYFGPEYQDRMTVVHEMGHFARMHFTENAYQSYDAAEFNSQGNEMLFLAFMRDRMSEDLYTSLIQDEMWYWLSSVYLYQMINAFEYEVYNAESPTGEDILAIFERTCERFGGYEILCEFCGLDVSEFWQYVVITQPAYYISYAVSAVPALELYLLAQEDYQNAVDMYMATLTDPVEGFLEVLTPAGFSDPFDADTVKGICETFLSMDFLK